MMHFLGSLAMFTSNLATEAAGFDIADHAIDLTISALVPVFPFLYQEPRAQVAQTEQLFAAFMDQLPGYSWIKTSDGRYVYINQKAKELLPFQHDYLGKTDAELWPGPLSSEYRANDLKVIETGRKVEAVESIFHHGEQRFLLNTKFPIFDQNGAIIMVGGTSVDITEQKRIELALRESEQKYKEIFENSLEGIFQTTPDGRFISANPALVKMFGFSSAQELIRERVDISNQHYVDPRRRVEFKRQLEEHGVVKGFELEAYRKDGSTIWLSENVRAVRNEAGKVIYYEGTTEDITERRNADHALSLFRTLIDRSTDAIEVIDPKTLRFLDCNKPAYEDLGYSREEFLKLSVFDIDPRVDHSMLARIDEQLKSTDVINFESVHRRKDGSTFPVEINLKVVRLQRDYRLAVVRDITERKLAEEALRQTEQKYRELFENAKDAIYVHDLSGRYTSLNQAAEKLSGYSRAEIIGRHFRYFVAPEYVDYVNDSLCRKLQTEGETFYEIEIITKSGGRVPIEVSSRLIMENGRAVAVQGTARNISERKRAEEAQRRYSRLLIEAQEAERQNIARELHDQIGQVLTAIRINLQTVRRSCETAESEALIDEGTGLTDQALEQVRDLSFELRPSLLDDLGLVAALRWYGDRYAQRTGIQTKTVTNLASGQGRFRKELETACFRIVQEALTNVARHAQARNVFINLETLNYGVSLSIKDDGIGFDEHSRSAAASPQLGLRGMQERALALGGKLDVNSATSRGTEIRAHFPNAE